jgi:hypothetical protein
MSKVSATSIIMITVLWKKSADGMSQTMQDFSTRHCLICQFIALRRLGVTLEFRKAKETPTLMVLCVRSDESGHGEKMRSFFTTFT